VISAGTITILDNTSANVHVRVTASGEAVGDESFVDLAAGDSRDWSRDHAQVAFAWREDTGATEVFMVTPGNQYTVG
jgi:hypothetical protein